MTLAGRWWGCPGNLVVSQNIHHINEPRRNGAALDHQIPVQPSFKNSTWNFSHAASVWHNALRKSHSSPGTFFWQGRCFSSSLGFVDNTFRAIFENSRHVVGCDQAVANMYPVKPHETNCCSDGSMRSAQPTFLNCKYAWSCTPQTTAPRQRFVRRDEAIPVILVLTTTPLWLWSSRDALMTVCDQVWYRPMKPNPTQKPAAVHLAKYDSSSFSPRLAVQPNDG